MARNEIHLDDNGTQFVVTLSDDGAIVDLTDMTMAQFVFRKPDRTLVKRSVGFLTDGSDGNLLYIIQEGDLDQIGNWALQVHVVFPMGTWRSDITEFLVHPNL